MNLVIDVGNTNAKICVYCGDDLVSKTVVPSSGMAISSGMRMEAARHGIGACILGSVKGDFPEAEVTARELGIVFYQLTPTTPVPISNGYSTPETLGADRLAAAVGASVIFPGSDVLIIDAGTAITYDMLINGSEFAGGNIAPGIMLRLKALHDYTNRLPLVEPNMPCRDFGLRTAEAVNNGVVLGVAREIEGYVADLKQKNVKAQIILTGGDSIFLSKLLKIAIFAAPNLVTIGLNRILNYNVSKNH